MSQRVTVWNGDKSEHLGEGVLGGEVTVYSLLVREGGQIKMLSLTNPEQKPDLAQLPPNAEVHKGESVKITLDNGEVVYGCHVWWDYVVSEDSYQYANEEPDIAKLLKISKASAAKFSSN